MTELMDRLGSAQVMEQLAMRVYTRHRAHRGGGLEDISWAQLNESTKEDYRALVRLTIRAFLNDILEASNEQ